MNKPVQLSTGLGEIMAPQTLLTPLLLTPDGEITVEPGALHGRSGLEGTLQFVQKREELDDAKRYWLIWVATELDGANQPLRYKGLSVSELWVDPMKRLGYKSVAQSVNRMSEALRGGCNMNALNPSEIGLVAQQLKTLAAQVWERSDQPVKDALSAQ